MTKWKTLQHNGILFPPAYEAQGIKVKIRGELITLSTDQEEMVYQWAKKKDTPYAQDKVFQKNFTADFAKTLDSKFKKISYEDIDFSDAYTVVDKEKDLKEMMTKEEKKEQAKKRKETSRRAQNKIWCCHNGWKRSRSCKLYGRTSRNFYWKRRASTTRKMEAKSQSSRRNIKPWKRGYNT